MSDLPVSGLSAGMAETATWILAFDVRHPRRLRKLSQFLEQRSQRVQRSVFELVATPTAMAALLKLATVPERFDPTCDSLRAYRLCGACMPAAKILGQGPSLLSAGGALVFS